MSVLLNINRPVAVVLGYIVEAYALAILLVVAFCWARIGVAALRGWLARIRKLSTLTELDEETLADARCRREQDEKWAATKAAAAELEADARAAAAEESRDRDWLWDQIADALGIGPADRKEQR